MGKGSNVQKAAQARERNMKDKGKTDEERKAALAKAKLDATAFVCALCKQTFMVNARPPLLWQHVVAKHGNATPGTDCFPEQLKDFDPNDPDGSKKAAADKAAGVNVPKKVVKKDDGLDMLDLGLKVVKKK